MAWKKNSQEAISRFDELVAVAGAQRKVMFGCPVYELQGQRYALLHENRVVLRLSPAHAAQLIAKGGRAFEPMKGPRKDRVVVQRPSRKAHGHSACGSRGRFGTHSPCKNCADSALASGEKGNATEAQRAEAQEHCRGANARHARYDRTWSSRWQYDA
jgi:hypothetical protein